MEVASPSKHSRTGGSSKNEKAWDYPSVAKLWSPESHRRLAQFVAEPKWCSRLKEPRDATSRPVSLEQARERKAAKAGWTSGISHAGRQKVEAAPS